MVAAPESTPAPPPPYQPPPEAAPERRVVSARTERTEPARRVPEQTATQQSDEVPVRGVVNGYLFTAFDFSELTQGATVGLEINFLRGTGGSLGLTMGVGILACVLTGASCSKAFLHFPLAFKGGVRLGRVVELNLRIGAAPAFIWRNGGSATGMVKFLVGTGLFFQTGRGGVFLAFDLLPNNGLAHVVSLGAVF